MERAFGTDFARVRLHTDAQADWVSRVLGARAFTTGQEIFFRRGEYRPGALAGQRLLAHELTHVAQQEAGLRTARRYRLAPADDPGERAADRAADDMILGGRAQPVTMTSQVPLIQRKAFIGSLDATSARRVKFDDFPQGELGGSPPGKEEVKEKEDVKEKVKEKEDVKEKVKEKEDVKKKVKEKEEVKEKKEKKKPRREAEDLPPVPQRFERIPYELGDLGTGERNLALVLVDHKSRYFRNIGELYRYARRETDNIGYVDREKVWVRLPKKFLVLGEDHTRTTLMDLVKATGVEEYLYEGAKGRPSPYLDPDNMIPEMEHQLEEKLPKGVLGLIGVQKMLDKKLGQLDLTESGWKSEIRGERLTAERANPAAEKATYEAELEKWSLKWEAKNQSPEERGERKEGQSISGMVGQHKMSVGGLYDPAPATTYERSQTEVRTTLWMLRAMRGAARGKDDPITKFYVQYRSIIDKTIAQLEEGLPVELTRMFLKMATGKFDLKGLIDLLSGAAEKELTELKVPSVGKHASYAAGKHTGAEATVEELRDSYMLHRIIDAKKGGCRLAGLGDAHRQRLQGVLHAMDPSILVQSSTDFYIGQYRLHPDRN